ncbi:MAG: FG-GAP-like repeat-containing protein [Planctomycetota bacterium]
MRGRNSERAAALSVTVLVAAAGWPVAAMGQGDPLTEPFPARWDLTELDGQNGFAIVGTLDRDFVGSDVAAVGDLNADGIDDLAVTAVSASASTGDSAPRMFIVYGSRDLVPPTRSVVDILGDQGFAAISREKGISFVSGAVAPAGDVNGDGIDDVIFGSPTVPFGTSIETGEVYVLFGRAGGFAAEIDLAALDGSDGFRMRSEIERAQFGMSVAGVGDVNGDGTSDVMIGEPGRGRAYVVFGREDGFPAVVDQDALDGETGFIIPDASNLSRTSDAVASAGDVNGDGIADMILGRGVDQGGVHVIFGRSGTFSPQVRLNSLDGSDGFRINPSFGRGLGHAVASAGDVNGDGFDDIIASSVRQGSYYEYYARGRTFVMFGKAGPFDAAVPASGLTGDRGFRIEAGSEAIQSGSSVGPAGDINGDGIDDVIVGARLFGWRCVRYGSGCYGRFGKGATYVIYGRSDHFDDQLSLDTIEGTRGFVVIGSNSGQSGWSVDSAGDVNGDGRNDIAVGQPYARSSLTGSAHVIFGRSVPCIADLDGDGEPTLFDFLAFQNLFDAGDPLADFDGDGSLTIFDFLAFQNAFDAGCP